MTPGAMIVSVPFSELTTDATVDEYIKADREFYDAGNSPFFGPGNIVLSFNSLSALAKQTVRQCRLAHEMERSQLTDDSYSPTFNRLCQELIDLLFPEGEREGVGNVDTILEKAKAEMEQLAEYRRVNEAKSQPRPGAYISAICKCSNSHADAYYCNCENRNYALGSQDPHFDGVNGTLKKFTVEAQLTEEFKNATDHLTSFSENVCVQKTEDEIRREKYAHYYKCVKGLDYVDVYRVLELFSVSDQAIGHAVKKLLCAGSRGAKDRSKDVAEAIVTLQRRQEMDRENG